MSVQDPDYDIEVDFGNEKSHLLRKNDPNEPDVVIVSEQQKGKDCIFAS